MRDADYEACPLRDPRVRDMTRKQCRDARVCWFCASLLTGKQLYWCGDECVARWGRNHNWTAARVEALERANYRCQRCGAPATEVNHRDPLVGRGYHAGCVHHPENLEALCHPCHVAETTRQLRARMAPKVEPDPGLTLWEGVA